MNYTYIVRCADDTLYTGWTNDLDNRIATHNSGKGAKYTRTRLPISLVYYEIYDTRSEAMSRECQIKRMSRAEKIQLIEKGSMIMKPPCKDCSDRQVGCHSTCEKYLLYKSELDKIKDSIQKERDFENLVRHRYTKGKPDLRKYSKNKKGL